MDKVKFHKYKIGKNSTINDKDFFELYEIKEIFYNSLEKPIDFEIGSFISKGSFGSTFKACTKSDSKCKYILKKINIFRGDTVSYSLKDFKNEILLQNTAAEYGISDPVILAYILEDKKECGFVMRRYNLTVYDYLNDPLLNLENKKITLKKIRDILERLILDAKIHHGDLHLKNLMIDEHNEVKVIDFGNSGEINERNIGLDSEMVGSSFEDLYNLDQEQRDDLMEYWFEEVMDGFNDYIIDY